MFKNLKFHNISKISEQNIQRHPTKRNEQIAILRIKQLKRDIFNCYDWNDISNCDDVRASYLAGRLIDYIGDIGNPVKHATNLYEFTTNFCNLPSMQNPTDKVLLLLGHIVQELQLV